MVDSVYTPTTGLMSLLFTTSQNGAEVGTGIYPLLNSARNLLGPNIPKFLVDYNVGTQINLFGSYPTSDDFGPSLAFAILFAIAFIFHLIIFIINTSRGHYFYLSVIWMVYSIFKIIGFALRVQWSYDVTQIAVGLTSEVFLLVPSIVIVSANLILAQRLFTWRHPVGGSRNLFWSFMISTYCFVVILIAVTILASFVPYLRFLSHKSYRSWIHTVQFTSILVILYSLTSAALIGLSFWLPTKKDELRYTYQPWWIESFAPFYFVEKNAAQKAERGFMKRNSNHRHATRVIAATHHHYRSVKGLTNKRGTLKHNTSMGILIITTVLIFIAAICRAIVVFQARQHRFASPAENKYLMYVVWGVFELIVMILYIVGRIDLRFYRPDRLPLEVRRIVTAEQTYYPSSDEDEEGFHRDRPETYEKMRRDNIAHGYKNSESRMEPAHLYPERGDGRYDEESALEEDDAGTFDDDDVDSNEWDFTVPQTKTASTSSEDANEKHPPYPVSEKHARQSSDNESEFHF
ncbi:hypothetical protein KGF57_001812 [Candida theae]|uniref:Uncharacterized protein n=1 Tax=Candida theae TaxID=1198502 RepID=A0AAD5FZH7_9ASCO|nr:uncharacterized protein KGF57_001812 [Candida theae]KAI5960880.1 hypothetical protein KGF57_001812 [Candida theae]